MNLRFSERVVFILQALSVIAVAAMIIVALWVGIRIPPTKKKDVTQPPNIGLAATTESSRRTVRKSPVGHFRYAAVAADGEPCSTIGTEILTVKRGSAVDAAIATMICVGVVNCHSTGIGGGHFMTIYDTPRNSTSKEFVTILAREKAPHAATADMYLVNTNPEASRIGGLAIAVPGEIKGYFEAWKRFGKVPWEELFTDTIYLCRHGFKVNSELALALQKRVKYINVDPNWRDLVYKQDGSLATEGDVLKNIKLAQTLEYIAADPESFYNSSSQLSQDILADIREYGGIINASDLDNYTAYIKPALKMKLNNGGYYVYSPRPPSSGIIYQLILSILDGFNLTASDRQTTKSLGLTYHRIIEAFKFAFAKRSAIGDEQYIDIETLLHNLTSKEYANSLRENIDDQATHDTRYYKPVFDTVEDGGTAHISVLAPDGGAVSLTSTINLNFGSTARGNRTGIIFNNEMDDFSTPNTTNYFNVPSSRANYIAPGKMPMSSMCPTIITDEDGRVVLITGASGGTKITTSTALVTLKTLWLGESIENATDEPRIHHQLLPDVVSYEAGLNMKLLSEILKKNHSSIENPPIVLSVVQSIHNRCRTSRVPDERTPCISAVSDWRKCGVPDGF